MKKLHTVIGLILFIPLLTWSLTGLVFLIKPGYEGAYARIYPKTYPMEEAFVVQPAENWHEFRVLKTVLGRHLLVKQDGVWRHLDPDTLMEKPVLSDRQRLALVKDAIAINQNRYGNIIHITPEKIYTDTGVEIQLEWSNLSISQVGRDTRFLNALYKIHYLQWLGFPLPNRILGATGIVLLLVLVVLGFSLYVKGRR